MNLLYRLESKLRSAVPPRLGTAVWQDLYLWKSLEFPDASDEAAGIRWATSEDRALLVQRDGERTAGFRLGQGNQAAVVIGESGIEGIVWFARHVYDDMDTGLRFPLQDNQVWLFGAWVSRGRRGKGVYRKLTSFAANALREQSAIDQIFLAIDRSNRISRAVHERLGARRIGSLRGGRIFQKSSYRVKMGEHVQRCTSGTTMQVELPGHSRTKQD